MMKHTSLKYCALFTLFTITYTQLFADEITLSSPDGTTVQIPTHIITELATELTKPFGIEIEASEADEEIENKIDTILLKFSGSELQILTKALKLAHKITKESPTSETILDEINNIGTMLNPHNHGDLIDKLLTLIRDVQIDRFEQEIVSANTLLAAMQHKNIQVYPGQRRFETICVGVNALVLICMGIPGVHVQRFLTDDDDGWQWNRNEMIHVAWDECLIKQCPSLFILLMILFLLFCMILIIDRCTIRRVDHLSGLNKRFSRLEHR